MDNLKEVFGYEFKYWILPIKEPYKNELPRSDLFEVWINLIKIKMILYDIHVFVYDIENELHGDIMCISLFYSLYSIYFVFLFFICTQNIFMHCQ